MGVSLLGDGYSDLAKHLHVAMAMVMAGWMLLLFHAVLTARAGYGTRTAAATVLAASSLATLVLVLAIARQPVAMGTLDPLPTLVAVGEPRVLTAWAKDPLGVGMIEAHVGDKVYPGTSIALAPDVDRMFPLARGHPGQRYQVAIVVPDTPGWFRVGIRVRNHAGVVSEIDSIWLEAR